MKQFTILKKVLKFLSTKGIFAFLDQALFAGSNFLLNILLARWMSPQHYGAFVMAYSVFILISSFHTAILTEPLVIFSNRKYSSRIKEYLGVIFNMHILLMLPLIAGLVVISFIMGKLYGIETQEALHGIAWVIAAILLLWVVRRAFYATLQIHFAALSSLLYLLFFVPILFFMHTNNMLNHFSVFFPIGLGSLLAIITVLPLIKPIWNPKKRDISFKDIAMEHWVYGRWAMGVSLLAWITQNIYYWVLPSVIGIEGVAGLRAILNLRLPFANASFAFSILFLPILAKNFHNKTREKRNKPIIAFSLLLFGSALAYSGLLLIWGDELLAWLYTEKYSSFENLIPVLSIFPICTIIVIIFTTSLKALEQPKIIFFGNIGSCFVSLSIGVLLSVFLGVKGALYGYIVSQLFGAFLFAFYFTRVKSQSKYEFVK